MNVHSRLTMTAAVEAVALDWVLGGGNGGGGGGFPLHHMRTEHFFVHCLLLTYTLIGLFIVYIESLPMILNSIAIRISATNAYI